jgi:DNA-binding Lrp family transcriptional regulator
MVEKNTKEIILNYLKSHPNVSMLEISRGTGLSYPTVRDNVYQLVLAGKVNVKEYGNINIVSLKAKKSKFEQIDPFRGWHRYNCVRINPKNSFEHELKKFKICYNLAKEGKMFITEAISRDGKRKFDIVTEDGEIIEVETGKSYKKSGKVKEVKYNAI